MFPTVFSPAVLPLYFSFISTRNQVKQIYWNFQNSDKYDDDVDDDALNLAVRKMKIYSNTYRPNIAHRGHWANIYFLILYYY
jgi:hypothetical protein